jgi:hypothetical protein
LRRSKGEQVSDDESDKEEPTHDEEGNRKRTRKWLKSLDLRSKYNDGHQHIAERHDAIDPRVSNEGEHLPSLNCATRSYENEATILREVDENAI